MKISDYISEKEAIKSITATRLKIDNTPDDEALKNMRYVAAQFDRIREYFNRPIAVTSFYRCKKLNKAVGGSSLSYHTKGAAIDIDADVFKGLTNIDIFKFIYDNLEWSELIYEFPDLNLNNPNWIHYALIEGKKTNRIKTTNNGGYRYLTSVEIASILLK